jgi:hypothetical protein
MKDNTNDSSSPVIGGLEIRRNGAIFIKKSFAHNLTEEDFQKFNITMEFIVYALNKTDWMSEFVQKKALIEHNRKKSELKSTFRLIEGGDGTDEDKK